MTGTVESTDCGADFAERAHRFRRELHVHCYRMLGSFDEAEDVVQEALVRAWRRRDDLEEPGALRAWLYRIATHACLDAIKAKGRRVPSLSSMRDIPWLEPYPDDLLAQAAAATDEPHERVIGRETIALTFLAVIQVLPPRQRAVLILCDVLDWTAADAGDLLDLSTAATNSALQRARSTMRRHLPVDRRDQWSGASGSPAERELLEDYMRAYETGDTGATLALLAEDVRVTMPPAPYLFEGRDAILGLAARARSTGEWRLVATGANRQPAAACYLRAPGDDEFRAFKIDVLRAVDGLVAEVTTFGAKHFPAFGLPAVLP